MVNAGAVQVAVNQPELTPIGLTQIAVLTDDPLINYTGLAS